MRVSTELNKSPSRPLTSFTVFADLPIELKAEVWKYSILPRIIICGDGESKGPLAAKPPAILHACHQSREEGLKIYTKIVLIGSNNEGNRGVYVDYGNDIFYLSGQLPPMVLVGASTGLRSASILRPSWSQPIRRLYLHLIDANNYISRKIVHLIVPNRPVIHLLFLLRIYFPSLQELLVIDPENKRSRVIFSRNLRQRAKIEKGLKLIQEDREFMDLKLSFEKLDYNH